MPNVKHRTTLMWTENLMHFDFVSNLVEQKHGTPLDYWVGYDDRDEDGIWTTSFGMEASSADGHHVMWSTASRTKTCAAVKHLIGG